MSAKLVSAESWVSMNSNLCRCKLATTPANMIKGIYIKILQFMFSFIITYLT